MKLLLTTLLLIFTFSQSAWGNYQSLKKNSSLGLNLAVEDKKGSDKDWSGTFNAKLSSKLGPDASLYASSDWDQDSETTLHHSKMDIQLGYTLWSEDRSSLSFAYKKRFYSHFEDRGSNYERLGFSFGFPTGTLEGSLGFYYVDYTHSSSTRDYTYYIPISFSTLSFVVEKFKGYAYLEYLKYLHRQGPDSERFILTLGLERKFSKKCSLEFYLSLDPFRQGDGRFIAEFSKDHTVGLSWGYKLF